MCDTLCILVATKTKNNVRSGWYATQKQYIPGTNRTAPSELTSMRHSPQRIGLVSGNGGSPATHAAAVDGPNGLIHDVGLVDERLLGVVEALERPVRGERVREARDLRHGEYKQT